MSTSILRFLDRFSLLLLAAAIFWGASLFVVRWWTLKRYRQALNQEEASFDDLEMPLSEPHPQDLAALAHLKEQRRRYLLKLWPDTRFNFRDINDLALTLVSEIARIYYPEEERPELKASLADMVALYRRVGVRLAAWLEAAPFRPLKDMELATLMLLHDTYQKIRDNLVHQFLQRHHLYRAARWAWGAVNIINPYYWGRRAAYKGTREFLSRVFLAKVVTVVGEESMRLYSRRSPNLRLFRRYLVGIQEMVNLALDADGSLPAVVVLGLMKSVLRARGLEDQEKVDLLKRLARPRRQDTPLADLALPEQEEVRAWITGLVKSCWQGDNRQEHLDRVEGRWREVAALAAPES